MWFWIPAAGMEPRSQSLTLPAVPERRITYAAYGEMVELAARGLVAAGIRPGEMIGIFLPNCWEFGVAYHAATLAGAMPTTLNPTYREREVRIQLEDSGAVALISDGSLLSGIDLSGLPSAAQGLHGSHARAQRVAAIRFAFSSRQHACLPNRSETPSSRWRRFPSPAGPPGCPRESCCRITTWWPTSIRP